MRISKKFGFTLIEIIVVVAIIGILASIATASFSDSRNEAKYTSARSDIQKIADLMIIARGASSHTVAEITGSKCTECTCRIKGSIQSLSSDHACWLSYKLAIDKLNLATKGQFSLNIYPTDPWGAPYLINENEGEKTFDFPDPCHQDNISSAGPDGKYYNDDDIRYAIPVLKCTPELEPHSPIQNWY